MYSQYNILGDHPLIPQQAFLFVPYRASNPKQKDDFKIGQQKGIRRLLFEGWAEETYTTYQLQRLKQLDDYIKRKGLQFGDRWDKSWRMRWLLSTGCKVKKTIEDMRQFDQYQNSIKELSFTSNIAKYLNRGIYYMAGRDCHYRPIFIFDVQKVIKLDMTEDQILETQTYFFQYALRNLLIPGQVENWITIIDAAHIGLFSLMGTMKKSSTFLSQTYRSRMFVAYVARVPSSISFIWGIAKKFLEEQTVKKINFFDERILEPIFEFCNPSQVEVKFGGTLPDIEDGHFWPPREVSPNYKCQKSPVRMLSAQEYTEYYTKKVFYDTKFQQQHIITTKTSNSTDLRDNPQAHKIKHIEKQFRIMMDTAQEDKPDPNINLAFRPLNYLNLIKKSKNNLDSKELTTSVDK